jgi:hypothetical protein
VYIKLITLDFQRTLDLEPGNKQAAEDLMKVDKLKSRQPAPSTRKKVTITEVSGEQPPAQAPPKTEQKAPDVKPVEKKPAVTETKKPEVNPAEVSVEPSRPTTPPKVTEVTTTPKPSSPTSTAVPTKAASTTPARSFQFKIELPKEPPKTAYEFEAFWRNAKHEQDLMFEYFKVKIN